MHMCIRMKHVSRMADTRFFTFCDECPVPRVNNERRERKMQLYDELVARGLIAQVTDEKEIREW